MIPLSVLDTSPVTDTCPGAMALHNSIDLARFVDQLGFKRYWLAEHHNAPSVASSTPDIMMGQIASVTQNIRVGSGGVMIRNHAPLVVAERFKVLEALFPGRIDLGIGRSQGADAVTSDALRQRQNVTEDDFQDRLLQLIQFETRDFPQGHPLMNVYAMPKEVQLPPIWLLGSTGFSANFAAEMGAGFSFAHHFSNYDAVAVMRSYRERFLPSKERKSPRAMLAVHIVCGETDAEAEHLAASFDLYYARSSRREHLPLSSPEKALSYSYTELDRERITTGRERIFVGNPETVFRKLAPLIEETRADELSIISLIYDHDARRRCYELIAERFGLVSPTFTRSLGKNRGPSSAK